MTPEEQHLASIETRETNADTRATNADTRDTNATTRELTPEEKQRNTETRTTNSDTRKTNRDTRKTNADIRQTTIERRQRSSLADLHKPLRRWLVNLALLAFIITCIVSIRTMVSISDELHQHLADFGGSQDALRITIQAQAKDINRSLTQIGVTDSVLVDRLDDQLTKQRLELAATSKIAASLAARASRDSQELSSKLVPAAAAITSLADDINSGKTGTSKPTVITTPSPQIITVKSSEAATQSATPASHPPSCAKPQVSRWQSLWNAIHPWRCKPKANIDARSNN